MSEILPATLSGRKQLTKTISEMDDGEIQLVGSQVAAELMRRTLAGKDAEIQWEIFEAILFEIGMRGLASKFQETILNQF